MTEANYAYEGLDRLLHERARLSILTALMTTESARAPSRTSSGSASSPTATSAGTSRSCARRAW